MARKLGAPFSHELAIGAVTANGGRFLNEELIDELGITRPYLEAVTAAESAAARRHERRFRGARAMAPMHGRTVIVIDDGLATGATMRAAVRSVGKRRPDRLIVAVPVGSSEACDALRGEADEVVRLRSRSPSARWGSTTSTSSPSKTPRSSGWSRRRRRGASRHSRALVEPCEATALIADLL